MLELVDRCDYRYWQARQTGRLLGRVEGMVARIRSVIKGELSYGEYINSHPEEDLPEKYKRYHTSFEKWCDNIDDLELEVADYVLKYETLNEESLAKKILQETEHWYLG